MLLYGGAFRFFLCVVHLVPLRNGSAKHYVIMNHVRQVYGNRQEDNAIRMETGAYTAFNGEFPGTQFVMLLEDSTPRVRAYWNAFYPRGICF